jgi:hypothetical protein
MLNSLLTSTYRLLISLRLRMHTSRKLRLILPIVRRHTTTCLLLGELRLDAPQHIHILAVVWIVDTLTVSLDLHRFGRRQNTHLEITIKFTYERDVEEAALR